jgi:uncharacterized small protein (DUF1192 family)
VSAATETPGTEAPVADYGVDELAARLGLTRWEVQRAVA